MGFQPVEKSEPWGGRRRGALTNSVLIFPSATGFQIIFSGDVAADSTIHDSVSIMAGAGADLGYIRVVAGGAFNAWKVGKGSHQIGITFPAAIKRNFDLPKKRTELRFLVNPDKSITIDLRAYLKAPAVAA